MPDSPPTTERSISPQVLAEVEQALREIESGIESGRWSIERVQIEARYLLRLIGEKGA